LSRETRAAIAIISLFFAARSVFALTLGLGVDEAYTLVISRQLQLSYFDHPPLHQWLAHFSAAALGESPAARLPFVALFAGSGWWMYILTRRLFGAEAGLAALVALNATPFFFASAGAWIVPDGPLVFALLGAANALAALDERPSLARWLALGAWFGLAGLSKYSAALTACGAAAFILVRPDLRRQLATPAPYLAKILALALVAPVFVWNSENHWASFAFQGARGAPGGSLRLDHLAQMIGGEAAYLSPWIGFALVAAALALWRNAREARVTLCLWLALPTILVFTLTPLWGARGLPHWPMPGWLFLYPLLGAWAANREWRRWGAYASVVTLALALMFVSQARLGWATPWLGKADVTREALDWGALRDAFPANAPPAFAVSVKWSDAGKIGVALGRGVPVLVFSDDPRGFAFQGARPDLAGKDGALVVRADQEAAARAALGGKFASLGAARPISVRRAGVEEIPLVVIPVQGLAAL